MMWFLVLFLLPSMVFAGQPPPPNQEIVVDVLLKSQHAKGVYTYSNLKIPAGYTQGSIRIDRSTYKDKNTQIILFIEVTAGDGTKWAVGPNSVRGGDILGAKGAVVPYTTMNAPLTLGGKQGVTASGYIEFKTDSKETIGVQVTAK